MYSYCKLYAISLINLASHFQIRILEDANLGVFRFRQIDDAKIDSPKHRIDEENQDEQNESSIYIAGAAVLHRSGMLPV